MRRSSNGAAFVQGLRIAMVKEGVGHDNGEPAVDAKVRQAGDWKSM